MKPSHAKLVLLEAQHQTRVIDIFTEAFCLSEPMTRYVGMTYPEFTPFAQAVVKKAIEDRLSVVAVENGKVIACTLVEDMTAPLIINFPVTPKFDPIFSLLENLSQDFFKKKTLKAHDVAHLFITAVSEKHRNQGLSKLVNFGAIELATEKKFSFMFSELTHNLNAKGLVKYLEYEKMLLGSIKYDEYIFNGIKPFANLPGKADAYLWSLAKKIKINDI